LASKGLARETVREPSILNICNKIEKWKVYNTYYGCSEGDLSPNCVLPVLTVSSAVSRRLTVFSAVFSRPTVFSAVFRRLTVFGAVFMITVFRKFRDFIGA
jgi:hypothetical protein